jgi:threonine dehydrogenase-like Zn-dependent dehydrogenase
MTDFKVGDLVQIDPALVCGGARWYRGTGTVCGVFFGGTKIAVHWHTDPEGQIADVHYAARDLVLVSNPKEAAR